MTADENMRNTGASAGKLGKYARALIFFAAAVSLVVFVLEVFVPKPRIAPVQPYDGYAIDVMQDAVTPEKVQAEHERLIAFGSRFLGQPGFYETAEYIRERFKAAGLEVVEQDNRTAIPRTEWREIYVEEGDELRPLDDVEVFPFWPNHMQPMVTPAEGLSGELVLMTGQTLQTRPSFRGCIGLIDSSEGMAPPTLEYDWASYAATGLEAMIISHPKGLEAMPWPDIVGDGWIPTDGFINGSVPVNYVRLAATAGIFKHVGRRIRLCVKTVWDNAPNTTIIGILRSQTPSNKLMMVTADYGACGILPDWAPGVLQAYEPAIQLCLLEGLLPYRSSITRDVFFVALAGRAMSEDGARNLMRVLGTSQGGVQENRLLAALRFGGPEEEGQDPARLRARREARRQPLLERTVRNEERLQIITRLLAEFDAPDFFVDPEKTAAFMSSADKAARRFFEEQCEYVLDTILFERSEEALQAKIAFERDLSRDLNGPAFQVYLAAKRACDQAQSAAGYSVINLLRSKSEYLERYNVRARCRARFAELLAHHQEKQRHLSQDMALVDLFNPYDELFTVLPNLVPAFDERERRETVSFGAGSYLIGPLERVFESLMATARQRAHLEDLVQLPKVERWHDNMVWREMGKTPYGMAEAWRNMGYPCYRLLNFGRAQSYDRSCVPADLPFMHDTASMRYSLALTGEIILSLAHGLGKFPPAIGDKYDFGGRVLVSGVGQSIVPDYPLKNALLGTRSRMNPLQYHAPGFYTVPFEFADVYGEFDFFNMETGDRSWVNQALNLTDGYGFSPIACAFGEDGRIAYMKDEGEDGQRLYKSTGITWNDRVRFKDLTIVTFRASPVTVLDLENPQTLDLYGNVEFIDHESLTPFRKQCIFSVKSPFVAFLEPDKRFFIKLQAGSARNRLALVTRAFMLGIDEGFRPDPKREIDGPGFLAADTPILYDTQRQISASMLFLNDKRLELQNRHAMADERVNLYHRRAKDLDKASREQGKSRHTARLEARDSVTYNELNHPVLRESISEAVVGILWYLGLLVPFCFFFEKLTFGFSDIRKQIAIQGAAFTVAFALLRLLHPAFEMVRSSLMILLGFVIILLSGGITVLFSAKFRDNFQELRKRQGKVRAAEVNVLGVIATAFLLGLNNMHRRRVRTGLTCVTLVLMTFVMICFTSVQNDIVEETIAVGKAPYQGILVKKRYFEPIESLTGLTEQYGDKYDLCPREMYVGQRYLGQSYNPTIEILFEPEGGPPRSIKLGSIVKLSAKEPLRDQIRFVTRPNWFTAEQECNSEDLCPVMLPDAMARRLGVSPEHVESGKCEVRINGRRFRVQGIFEAASYAALRDLDGVDLLPFDIESMAGAATLSDYVVLAQDNDARISAERIVLCPASRDLQIQLQYGLLRCVSAALSMPGASYKEAKAVIDSYLERKAERVFYGLGGVAFRGRRTRETTVVGLLDLLLPLIIAALTVLNTMKSSVYERSDEIFVYNAVGIAPRYVFFMFFAEAFVYAVVGSVVGYIFSQGMGRILTELGMTGGLNMTFTSISTIYASLAIAGAVFISTYFPARTAMRIAEPAEDSGWRLPEPEGDALRFRLPFTFNKSDRIAILAFFDRYLQDHGEGSAARFYAGPPRMSISDRIDPLAPGAYTPEIVCTVWLKPFDLAVSQEMILATPVDEQTGEYIAEITLRRLSGTRESWLRLNTGFVRLIRRHLLHWRAVNPAERKEMFFEGRNLLRAQLTP